MTKRPHLPNVFDFKKGVSLAHVSECEQSDSSDVYDENDEEFDGFCNDFSITKTFLVKCR